ncbi:unnamed protein product [Acanthoscelides obtectus]|uniref:Uncharacterized protein n=1 Tax=Acanthoscelides obtectus TaxID=200917 RepID=A0A9P0Q2R2_ACAOB|nr:unnamed protein product [Acanthoscelides obtectus]CAK1660176.1 hypothetical protein AOBTE_LOCUS21892 [Acanthoscelides obtectus]
MESEAHASEPLKIEYAEVKQEPTEVVGESFGVEQPTWEWEMEDYENKDGMDLLRIKNEQSDVMSTVTCDLNGEAFNMKEGSMKLENDLDVKSEETQISHEYIIKDENESGAETASDR